MNEQILSIEKAFVKWSAYCVDWFMILFADPDYYWTEETYPPKKRTIDIRNPTKSTNFKNNKVKGNSIFTKIVKKQSKIKRIPKVRRVISDSILLKIRKIRIFNLFNNNIVRLAYFNLYIFGAN